MALKPGAGKKLLILAIVGGVLGFGIVKYTGASTKVKHPSQDSTSLTLSGDEEVSPEESDTDDAVASEGKSAAIPHKTKKASTTKTVTATKKKATVADEPKTTKTVTPKPAKKKSTAGERENLELDNF